MNKSGICCNNTNYYNKNYNCNKCISNNPCSNNKTWPTGPTGPQGLEGIQGETGPTGSSGTALSYADFYALMPPDNSATVAPGTDVSFSQDGPNSGVTITRTVASTFNLSDIGTYEMMNSK